MGTATKITGESFGYRYTAKLTMAAASKLISGTLTPQDADLHDISKEGLLITSISWRNVWAGSSGEYFIGIFNRTTNIAPIANVGACSYRDSVGQVVSGAVWSILIPQQERNVSILPGGGVPLIADFVSISVEAIANVAASTDFYIDIYYKWIPINPDDYRKILYARSI